MLLYDYLKKIPIFLIIRYYKAFINPVHINDILKRLAAIQVKQITCGNIYYFRGGKSITIQDIEKIIFK